MSKNVNEILNRPKMHFLIISIYFNIKFVTYTKDVSHYSILSAINRKKKGDPSPSPQFLILSPHSYRFAKKIKFIGK